MDRYVRGKRSLVMLDPHFSTLWENVDYSLHKLTHILKATLSVSEDADPINETINTLVCLAIDQAKDSRKRLLELHKHQYATKKETEKAEA
jgi:hypothetical protein